MEFLAKHLSLSCCRSGRGRSGIWTPHIPTQAMAFRGPAPGVCLSSPVPFFTSLFHPSHTGWHFKCFLKLKSFFWPQSLHTCCSLRLACPSLASFTSGLMSPLLRGPCLAVQPKAGVSFLSLWRLPLEHEPPTGWPLSCLQILLDSGHQQSRTDSVSSSLSLSVPGTQ